MHRQPKFKKMLATSATWQLLMISISYPLPTVAKAWRPWQPQESIMRTSCQSCQPVQTSGNWQHVDIKGF
jgi:hypothetical protein